MNDISGVVNFYKEEGVSSAYAVARIKKLFKAKKCGHTGTLDPMASGVLPICLGHATRFASHISAGDKAYLASFILGAAYDSFDTTGTVIKESGVKPSFEEIGRVLAGLTGIRKLLVPAFSAKKIEGRRAYDLARQGLLEDAGLHEMRIDGITLLSYEYPVGIFSVECGKGTYVRSIIHELGERTGAWAAMSGLTRTRCGYFYAKDALKWGELEELEKKGALLGALISPVEASGLKVTVVYDSARERLSHGVSPRIKDLKARAELEEGEETALVDEKGALLAAARFAEGEVKLTKVFI